MKHLAPCRQSSRAAFTLIELLIVIGIIAILAAMIVPIGGVLIKKRKIAVAKAELAQVETAIERYKAKMGFYPPDNPNSPITNQLYFELIGTLLSNNGTLYMARDGSGQILAADLGVVFGTDGLRNSSVSGKGDDERVAAETFVNQLHPSQIGELVVNGHDKAMILICSVAWSGRDGSILSNSLNVTPSPSGPDWRKDLNPWQYNSSHPTNNPNTFDLWVDITVGKKTNRISNWSSQPQVL
jgi:prepilin-type N-terminal cleavage/methylation domain-containing protein